MIFSQTFNHKLTIVGGRDCNKALTVKIEVFGQV